MTNHARFHNQKLHSLVYATIVLEVDMRVGFWIFGCCLLVSPAQALDTKDILGTWRLATAQRTIVDTGEVVDSYGGPRPNGWINYDASGRVMVVVAYQGREKPAGAAPTDAERARLHRSFFAYAGTYTFDGKSITHAIDTSWNETWTGTSQVRDVAYADGKLVYTTRPAPFSGDGKVSVVTLVWERPN